MYKGKRNILWYMTSSIDLPEAVTDTPNILHYRFDRGKKQIRSNLIALLKLIAEPIKATLIITPKMEKMYPIGFDPVAEFVRKKGGIVIYSPKGADPDKLMLEIAMEKRIPIITNDKFRQSHYDSFSSIKSLVIRFDVKDDSLIPRNDYWKRYLLRGKMSTLYSM